MKTATISSDKSDVSIDIDTSTITKGTYNLFVDSKNFAERRSLTYISKEYSFLLQLNKAIFLPGDLLQFRTFAIDSETRAVAPKCSSVVSIADSNGNAIVTFKNVVFDQGKYENQLELSSKAGLGIWKLQIQCDDEIVSKEFEIAEYTLPLVTGSLLIPENTPFKFGKVPISVEVTYTFGGEPTGTATVIIQRNNQIILKKALIVNSGAATFDANIVEDLKVNPTEYASFQANLVFEDPMTGDKVTDEKHFVIRPHAFYIYPKGDYNIKPGTPYKFTIALKKYDGSPALAGVQIQVIPQNPSTLPSQTLAIGDDGSVSSTIDVPADTQSISLKITADDSADNTLSASVAQAVNGSYLQIEVLTESPELGEPVYLKIKSGQPTDYVMIHIVSKGILIESSKVYFDSDGNEDNDLNTVVYSFTPSFKHAPKAGILAYYINKNNDFVATQVYVRLERNLPNYLTISSATQQVRPAANVNLNIESYIGSRVSLVAMDQRLLLLRDGSNITKQNVIDDIQKYTKSNIQLNWGTIAGYEYTFASNGLFVFTNIPRTARPVRPQVQLVEKFDYSGKDVKTKNIEIREDFREIFLWRDVNITNSANDYDDDKKGLEAISEKVPQSITNYLIYGVSMSTQNGMGLSDNVPSVTIFLPFFISLELPYSVKRYEVLVQDIVVFNYLKKIQAVEVKVTKQIGYDAVDLDKYGWKDINGFYVKTVTTKLNQNIKLQFAIRPKILGFIPIEVIAKGPLAGDGIKKQLRVIPEGIPRSITSSVFIALDSKTPKSENQLNCKFPDSAYQDTTSISATVIGDTFGKVLSNLDKLINMPGGCGEQTMLSLAPDIAIYEYLLVSEKLTSSLKETLQKYILAGYQNELRYQRTDGSFSAFGNNDKSGSTWLTAYVVEYFYFARDMISIDSKTIKKGADFVQQQQSADGSFKEPGRVIHADMQSGSGAGIGLTAYCVIMFTYILPGYPEYTATRDKAVKYLEDNISTNNTVYEFGIIANALILAKSSKADEAYNLFDAKKTETSSELYWVLPAPPSTRYQPRSLDIEVTAYGLLAVIKRSGGYATILKVVKYLISKSNNLGGYSSSQDTVMALYALSQFARTYSINANVKLSLAPDVGTSISTNIDFSNLLTVQSYELDQVARKIDITATTSDSGLAIVSLICNFYEDPTKVVPVFDVTANFNVSSTHRMTMTVCARYIPAGTSNMAIMIVRMPSGYIYNDCNCRKNTEVSKTEVTNQGTKITFYFNTISNEKSCVFVNAYRVKFVAELKPATIEVYDYYDTSKQGMTSYQVPV
ncbi:CD109 antigen-like [Chironomus tepperi]|uniref:CD109 antigen-like n=1 Tax=Chironomus tepperi TaxID=113505 RepID=UPI00391EE74B